MSSGDFDFFGGPPPPPPPPSGGQFGAPAGVEVNQFGMPVAQGQPLLPGQPLAPSRAVTPPPAAETGRQVAIVAGLVAAVVLLVVGLVWLQHKGQKTATAVSNTVLTPVVKAHQTEETVDLQQAAQAEETYLSENDGYATSLSQLVGFVDSPSTTVTVVSATSTAYCLRADDTSTFHAPSMYLSSAVDGATPTPCS